MIKSIFITIILMINYNAFAQASWRTNIAFILRDENGRVINIEEFKKSYKLLSIYGDTITNDDLVNDFFKFDEKTNYFVMKITTIGPRFSFGLVHNNQVMIIYLPFVHTYKYYAVDFKFRKGKFFFDFDIKNNEIIYFNNNMPHYVIKNIKWGKQMRKLKRSSYSSDTTYNKKQD